MLINLKLPNKMIKGIEKGNVKRFGGVVRGLDGKIIKHLEEGRSPAMSSVLSNLGSVALCSLGSHLLNNLGIILHCTLSF